MVDRCSATRGGQRPAPAPLPPELLILACRNAAIDLEQAPFEQLLKPVQVLANRFLEERESRAGNQLLLPLPLFFVQQIILEAAKADAIVAENVTRFQPIAQQAIDKKFVAVDQQPLRAQCVRAIQVTLNVVWHEVGRQQIVELAQ